MSSSSFCSRIVYPFISGTDFPRKQGKTVFCNLVYMFHYLLDTTFGSLWQACHILVLLFINFLACPQPLQPLFSQKLFQYLQTHHLTDLFIVYFIFKVRCGVEDTTYEAKAKNTKKIRGQGQPFRGQTLSRPRTDPLEAKDRNARGQGQLLGKAPSFWAIFYNFLEKKTILMPLNHISHMFRAIWKHYIFDIWNPIKKIKLFNPSSIVAI